MDVSENKTSTLRAESHHPPIVLTSKRRAFNQLSQSAIYKEDDKTVTLSVCGGSYGGGVNV
jgi:hypothetical protein